MWSGRTRATTTVILLGLLAFRHDAAADQPVQYEVIDFAKQPEAAVISAILGMSDSSVFFLGALANGSNHVFVWDPVRGLHDTIPDAGFTVTDISSFNSSGAYVALYDRNPLPAVPKPATAFVWSEDRGLRVLPPLPGDDNAQPGFINEAGAVFGLSFSTPSSLVPREVFWDSQLVPHVAGPQYDLNIYFIRAFGNLGTIAGSYLKDSSTLHAFVATGGLFFDLNPFGSPFSEALQMSGDCIAGWYQKADGNLGFFAHKGLATLDIGPVDNLDQVNQACDAIGTMTLPDGSSHAYIARLVNGSYNLVDLTPVNQLPGLIGSSVPPSSVTSPVLNKWGDTVVDAMLPQNGSFRQSSYTWHNGTLSVLPPAPGDTDTCAMAINNRGWAVGLSGGFFTRFCQAQKPPVLWIPVTDSNGQ
jgi:hypothetical protein